MSDHEGNGIPARRGFLKAGAALTAAALWPSASAARGLIPLQVAYAGSMGPVMASAVAPAVARALGVRLEGRGQGALGLAHLIVGGALTPDVFISVTRGPMDMVLRAGAAAVAFPVARTELVIAYARFGRFAAALARAAYPHHAAWWQIAKRRGFRFGRTDPLTDPQGLNVVFMMELAARYYHQPDLVAQILGPLINDRQIFPEAEVMARLEGGELDASSAYKTEPEAMGLPYIALPPAINLGDAAYARHYRQASVILGGRTHHPSPLVFYAAALKGAAQPVLARRFVAWLRTPAGQRTLRRGHYDSPGPAPVLTARP